MATADASKQTKIASKNKPREKDKERKQRTQKGRSGSERLKTVVRRLPPNLPEDVFWQSVQKWVTAETVTWREYYQGKFRKRLNQENIPSRAYIAFKDTEILATFSREYDGHLFRDKAGNESSAVVEFAPYQKVPTGKGKVDSRVGTIDKDEDYISFLESLKEPQAKPFDADTLEALVAGIQPPPPPTTTPLLEALKAEKSAQKDKEAILRNHAHHKDAIASTANHGKKEDGKKKAPQAHIAPTKSSEPHTSKKAAKRAVATAKAAAQQGQPANNPTQAKEAKAAQSSPPTKQKPTLNAPKAPKAHRERKGSKGAASAHADGDRVLSPVAPDAHKAASSPNATEPESTHALPLATAVSDPSANQATASSSRRGRPVIGLGSRHFEAALSGAVGGKPRREREKDKEPTSQSNVTASGAAAAAATSPRSRPKQVSSAASAANPPIILQRDGPASQTVLAGVIARPSGNDNVGPPTREDSSGGGGRGHRGRGRGRGRGGRGG